MQESKSRRGGKRAGAGRKPDIAANLILYDVASHLGELRPSRSGVGLRYAQNVIRESGASSVIGQGREKLLRELGKSAEGAAYLRVLKTIYLGKRHEAGFDA
jgi:hypothetical protein